MSSRRSLLIPLCALAGASASGCTFTHRCTVPDPVVEAAPGQRVKLPVALRYVPDAQTEVSCSNSKYHVWVIDAAQPTRVLFDRLAASMFDPVFADSGATDANAPLSATATLEIRLEHIDFQFVDPIVGPYRASVAYRATLRAPGGAEVASFDIAGNAERALQWSLSTHCPGIGGAVAVAMQDAGAELLRRFAAEPAVAAWFAGQAIPAPAFTVRPSDSYPVAVAATVPPLTDDDATARAAEPAPRPAPPPVGPGVAMPPRTFQLRVGLGLFSGDTTAGALEDAHRGLSVTVLGAEYRPARALGFELEAGGIHRAYSGRTLPPGGAFSVPQGVILDTRMVGIGVRAILPGGPVEPWVGAMGHVMRTEVCAEYSLLGVSGCSEASGAAWSAAFDVGGGLAVFPGRWFLGVEVRRLFARARLDPLARSASVGGVGTSLTFGASLP